jgi:hypothetical protein
LGRAVKPNRLLLPAFVPAVKAGLRLPRVVRASELGLPAVLLPWPLRWTHAGAEDFSVRAPETPWAGRAALPADRAPLPEPLPE